MVLPCPIPPEPLRVAEQAVSLEQFGSLTHQEMCESLLDSTSFPGLRQHAAALITNKQHPSQALELLFNDPLGLELDLFHPHVHYKAEKDLPPVHMETANGSTPELPLEDLFLINPQLYKDFLADKQKQAREEAAEREAREQEIRNSQQLKREYAAQKQAQKQAEDDDETRSEFAAVKDYTIGFKDQEGKEVLEVLEILPAQQDLLSIDQSIVNLDAHAALPGDPGSHILKLTDCPFSALKKPARLHSFQKKGGDGTKLMHYEEDASYLMLTKHSQVEDEPLALIAEQAEGQVHVQPIYLRFKSSTVEKVPYVTQRIVLAPEGADSEKIEELGRETLSLQQQAVVPQMEPEPQDNLSDDLGLAVLQGGPIVEAAPILSEDEGGFFGLSND